MSFGSPSNKIFPSPNNANPYSQKSFSNTSNAMNSANTQITLKPGSVSMGYIIESVALKSYTDLQRLVDILPSKEDLDKKAELAKYLSRTRNLLIRLQSLNKWNPSALKVDKCDKISNLLDEQSSFLMKTAEELSIMAYEKLPMARLQNLLPMIAADILASRTYSRLPNMIRLPVLRSQMISKDDKKRMLLELDRVLRIRICNSRLPYQMRCIDIGNGRLTFTVPNEFKVTCTLMSDHFDHSWNILDIQFLVKGNNVCRGRSLVHVNQLRALHDIVQIRMNSPQIDNRPSLFHLYDMLHSMALSMQLEVLHEQASEYMRNHHGVPIMDLRYTRTSILTFTYWHRSEKYANRPKHSVTISVDPEDPQRPLKVKHQPILSADNKYSDKMLDTCNLSIKNIIAECINTRIFSTLQMVQRLLFPFVNTNSDISMLNPVLLVPILDIDGKNNNYLKIQINSSNGYVKTSFEVTLDRLRGFTEDKINDILMSLDTDVNELLMMSYNTIDNIVGGDTRSSSNRECMIHRRNIATSLNKLRVILTKYHCLSIMQQSGYNDLHILLNRPPICRDKTSEKSPGNIIYSLLQAEAKGDCELVFIPINIEWNYYLIVVCETKFRMIPVYRVFGLNTTMVFSSKESTNKDSATKDTATKDGFVKVTTYTEKKWTLRPVKLSLISPDVIKRMKNINLDRYTESRVRTLKRPAVTCTELLHKIHSKNLKINDGGSVPSQDYCRTVSSDLDDHEFAITSLPAVIGYMKDNVIFKLLLHEIERRSFIFESERISDDIYVHSCKITRFPPPKSSIDRASYLMNKMLAYCTITYFAQPHHSDGSSTVKWEAQFFLTSPFILFDKTTTKSKIYSKKVVLCSKKCIEENSTGIKEAVEILLSCWEEMCTFCECCLLPFVDKAHTQQSDVKLTDYQFNQLSFTYGNDNQYKVTIGFSLKNGFLVSTDMNDNHVSKYTATNPHNLIRKDLDNYLNSHRNINVLTKVINDTLEFLAIVQPFSGSNLMVMQDSGSTHILRNYSLIVLDAYHVVLVFRERFALNIVLNNETHTVLLSDAHNNFHACNMSINEMPMFNEFMVSLEESFRINIEDEVWSGLFVDQLGILLGSNIDDQKITSPLENYLLSCLQLGSRKEISSPIPCCNEAHIIPGNELRIGLIVSKSETVPFWSLGMHIESIKTETPWLSDPEMLSMAKTVLETKIRSPKLPEIAISMFRKLFQLPSINLQKNILKIVTRPSTVTEVASDHSSGGGTMVSSLDLDWANVHEAISQPQEPSSIWLRFLLTIVSMGRPTVVDSMDGETERDKDDSVVDKRTSQWSVTRSLVVHYAAKSNQISILPGTSPQIIRHNLDKEANEMVVGKINGDTPLMVLVAKLMANVADYVSA